MRLLAAILLIPASVVMCAEGDAVTWSPHANSVTEGNSEALVSKTLEGIAAYRAQLSTIHASGVETSQFFDSKAKEWVDWGEVYKGEAWLESRPPWRGRIEMALCKVVCEEDHTSESESYVAIWDGTQSRRISKPSGKVTDDRKGPPEVRIDAVRELEGDSATAGMDGWIDTGVAAHNEKIDTPTFSKEWLTNRKITARRVTLADGAHAVELELRWNLANPNVQKQFYRYWFDEDRGYVMLGYTIGADGQPPASEMIVDQLKQVAQGVYYPTRLRTQMSDNTGRISRQESRIVKVEVNAPIPADKLTLPIPPKSKISYSELHYAGELSAAQKAAGAGSDK
jgi:hypothetical protein